MARIIRTVVENISVSESIDAEQAIYPRIGEAFDALKWLLARVPEIGELTDDVNWLYMQEGDGRVNIPALVVVYTFNHWEVVLKHILVRIPVIPGKKR
jgi:hypothetical protein